MKIRQLDAATNMCGLWTLIIYESSWLLFATLEPQAGFRH